MSKVLIDRELAERVCHVDNSTRQTARRELRTILATPSGTPTMPVKAWYEEVGDPATVRNRSVGFNQRPGDMPLVLESDALVRIACLEGAIAKRDARIVELESGQSADMFLTLTGEITQLRVELAAIRAQEPALPKGAILAGRSELSLVRNALALDCEQGRPIRGEMLAELDASIGRFDKLYAAPVSEAKAQDFEPLVCDYCHSETQDPWHGSGVLNGVESRHIHACSQCRNLLPTTKALAVLMPEPLMTAITRADDVLHALSNWESSSVKLEQRHGPEWTKEVDAIRRELHTQLARLNAAHVQQVSVPQCVLAWFEAKQAHVTAVDAYNARLAFVREHMPFGTSVDPEYQIMEAADRKARSLVGPMFGGLRDLAATPAAPAADALYEAVTPDVVEWLRCGLAANNRLVDGTHPALERVREALSAHRAKGVA